MMVSASAGEVAISGFVSPSLSVQVRPDAVPRDRLQAGVSGSTAGFKLAGTPVPTLSFAIDLRLGRDPVMAVVGVTPVDVDNDGTIDTVVPVLHEVVSNLVREVSITWAPYPALSLKAGRMPIPFTSTAQSADTSLLFPQRASPNAVFIADDDLGALVQTGVPEWVRLTLGVFNGTGVAPGAASTRGVAWLGRVDVTPAGAFDFGESTGGTSPFRLGIGAGAVWHPYTDFDPSGSPFRRVSDLRLSGSLRVAVAGLNLGAEVLWRSQTDSLSHRPDRATGAYVQGGYVLPLGIEPIARFGGTMADQTFEPRLTLWTDAGLNVYPAARSDHPDKIRVTAQYVGEFHVTEAETAHGAAARVQVSFGADLWKKDG